MTYDGLVLAAAVAELKRNLDRGHVQGIRQHNDTDLTFEVRSQGKSHLLFMSVDARFPRVYLTSSSLPVPQVAPNFCMLLRKHVKGSFITSVEQVGFDRVLHIRTEAPDGNRNVLVLEIMGKHSNLILLSDTGRILGAAKHIGSSVSRYRQVLPGRDYLPPPGAGKANPLEVSGSGFDALWRDGVGLSPSLDDVRRWLVASFSGIGPFLAEELVLRARAPEPNAVRRALEDLRDVVESRNYDPRLITDDRGAPIYAYPIPSLQQPAENQHERRSMNETLDTLFRSLLTRDEFQSEITGLESAIRRSIASHRNTIRELEASVAEGEKAERYKRFGELILGSDRTIAKGDKSARVVDYYDPELREVEIPLDETMTPKENAERLFRRYRKARDGALAARDRLKESRAAAKILESAIEKLPTAASAENVRALRRMLTDRGLLRVQQHVTAPGKREEPEFGRAKIRRTTSSDGFEILYGENSVSNDYLTGKVAKPNDLWFHARSVTGAHVVVRTANRPDSVPASTIRDAAEIAARNSDAKHSSLVAVDYTLKKHVRKPRAAPPGLVTYQKEKTIDVALR